MLFNYWQKSLIMSGLITVENSYVALLSLAEGFRTCSPPDYKSSVQCLLAILNLPVHHQIIAKTHLQLGNLIMFNTTNHETASKHFEQAV